MKLPNYLFVGTVLAVAPIAQGAINILAPGDTIVGINYLSSNSSLPTSGNESADKAVDGIRRLNAGEAGNKYLNFGKGGTGFIVRPNSASVIQSFTWTSANDSPGRSPATYEIWGTNDAIASTNNSRGIGESWTLINSGSLATLGSYTLSGVTSFSNSTSYSAYKVVFPTIVDNGSNSMQISEFSLYPSTDGTGNTIYTGGIGQVIAIGSSPRAGSFPSGESPTNLLQTTGKYLNFGGQGSGVIVTPAFGPSIVTSFQLTTGNDVLNGRNPSSYILYGTNSAIASTDHSFGESESWTQISSGALNLPKVADPANAGRSLPTDSEIYSFLNDQEFSSYKIVFPTLENPNDLFELGGLRLFVIPEPSTAFLSIFGFLAFANRRRR